MTQINTSFLVSGQRWDDEEPNRGYNFATSTPSAWWQVSGFTDEYEAYSVFPIPQDNGIIFTKQQKDVTRYLLDDYSFLSNLSGADTLDSNLLNTLHTETSAGAFENYRTSFADVIKSSFEETSSGEIQLINNQGKTNDTSSIAIYPESLLGSPGDIIINYLDPDYDELEPGESGFWAILHELGHAIAGLNDYAGSSQAGTFADTQKYSVMSYNPYGDYEIDGGQATLAPGSEVFASGLMLLDIIAIQTTYDAEGYNSANNTTRLGDTTYGLAKGFGFYGSTADDAFLYTIWDGGGSDTIDASGFNVSAEIDLREGRFSSIGKNSLGESWRVDADANDFDQDPGNVAIAYGTVIENAIGTDYNDRIIGNDQANTLIGGTGSDKLLGGAGFYDVADFTDLSESVTVTLSSTTGFHLDVTGNTSSDTDNLQDIEIIRARDGAGGDRIFVDPATIMAMTSDGEDVILTLDINGSASNGNYTYRFQGFDEIAYTSGNDTVNVYGDAAIHYEGMGGNNTLVLQDPSTMGLKAQSYASGEGLHVTSSSIVNTVDGSTYSNFQTFDNVAYAKIESLGRTYIGHTEEAVFVDNHRMVLDYSILQESYAFEFNLNQDAKYQVIGTSAADTVENLSAFVGNNLNNTYTFLGSSNNELDLFTGSGNDTIQSQAAGSEVLYYYGGGNDTVSGFNASIVLPSSIDIETDVAIATANRRLINSGLLYQHDNGSTVSSVYASDIVLTINGLGTITIDAGTFYAPQLYTADGLSVFLTDLDRGTSRVDDVSGYDEYVYTPGTWTWEYDEFGSRVDTDSDFTIPYGSAQQTLGSFGRAHFGLGKYYIAAENSTFTLTEGEYAVGAYSQQISGMSHNSASFASYAGNDTVTTADNSSQIIGGAGNDVITGGVGNDILLGNNGDDQLLGGDGNDLLAPGQGQDSVVNGGTGSNTVYYLDNRYSVLVDLQAGQADDNYDGTTPSYDDTLTNIQNIVGSTRDDVLRGDSQDNDILGYGGDDELEGRGGGDRFFIGQGMDTIADFDKTEGDSLSVEHVYVPDFASLDIRFTDGGSETIAEVFTQFGEKIAHIHMPLGQRLVSADVTLNETTGDDPYSFGLESGSGAEYVITGESISFKNNYNPSAGEKTIVWHFEDVQTPGGWSLNSFLPGARKEYEDVDYSLEIEARSSVLGVSVGGQVVLQASDHDFQVGTANDLNPNNDDENPGNWSGSSGALTVGHSSQPIGGNNDDEFYIDVTAFLASGQSTITIIEKVNAGHDRIILEGADYSNAEISLDTNGDILINLDPNTAHIIRIEGNTYFSGPNSFGSDVTLRVEEVVFKASGIDDVVVRLTDDFFVTDTDGTSTNVTGTIANDTFEMDEGHDTVYAGYGDDILNGGSGQDGLYGGSGNDTLNGGAGSDSLLGGSGDDTYIFGSASGDDFLTENISEGADKLVLGQSGIDEVTFADINMWLDGSNYLNIGIKSTGNVLSVQSAAVSGSQASDIKQRLETIEFSDSSTLDLTQSHLTFNGSDLSQQMYGTDDGDTINGNSGHDVLRGYDGDDILNGGQDQDTLYGGSGNDTLNGGADSDSLLGGLGDDTYIFGSASGDDFLTEDLSEGADKLVLGQSGIDEITFADINMWLDGSNYLNIGIKSTGNVLSVQSAAVSGSQASDIKQRLETIEFSDSSTLDLTQSHLTFNGSDLSQQMYGTDDGDTINGNSGHDVLRGYDGDDILNGGQDQDTLYGGSGNDTLNGGAGSDSLLGGSGDDTYIFGSASGDDFLTENISEGADKLVLGQSGIDEVTFADINMWLDGSNYLNIGIKSTGNVLSVQSAAVSGSQASDIKQRLETIEFSDSSTLDLTQSHLTFNGSALSQQMYGTDDGDTINGNSGHDVLRGYDGDDILNGGEDHDTLYGGSGNDILNGGAGSDSLYGDAGSDIAVYNAAYSTTNFMIIDYTTYLYLTDNVGTEGADYIYDIEKLEFSNGTYESGLFTALSGGTGNAANNTLVGDSGDNVLSGNAGDDTLIGGAGDDTLDGGDGTDTADYSGNGAAVEVQLNNSRTDEGRDATWNDTLTSIENVVATQYADKVYGTSAANIISSGAGDDVIFAGDGNDTVNGEAGEDTLIGEGGDDALNGGDGNDDLYGDAGDDILHGGNGADYLFGDEGDDTLNGDEGGDVLYGGDGGDTLHGGSDDDALYGDGGSLDESMYTYDGGSDTMYGNGGNDYMYGGKGNDFLYGDDQADVLYGGSGNDFLEGRGGDDTLYGDGGTGYSYTGDDELNGGAGSDTLHGQLGDDILWAGEGDDYLYGGAGGNTFVVYETSGQDNDMAYVQDWSAGTGNVIDLRDLLDDGNYVHGVDTLSDFVNVAQGANTTFQVDRDGTGTAHGWDNVIRLVGVTTMSTDEATLVANGTLLVA